MTRRPFPARAPGFGTASHRPCGRRFARESGPARHDSAQTVSCVFRCTLPRLRRPRGTQSTTPEQYRAVPASDTRAELALWRNRLQSLILPPDLSDEDFVGRWHAAKATGRGRLAATTLAQYRTEAERLFWYARHTGVPISNRGLDEFAAYVRFLQSPAPWAVRKAGVRRGRPTGGPFWGLCLPAQPARPKNRHVVLRLAARRRLPAA